MQPALKFSQAPEKGATVVVSGFACQPPHLTTITGRGTKDGSPIFHHSDGASWTRPEDITIIPARMAGLMADVCEGLHDCYPAVLADGAKGAIYLAVLPSYADTGNDQADYEALRDAVEAEARRLESEAGRSPNGGM
jgi:hypothetical protein